MYFHTHVYLFVQLSELQNPRRCKVQIWQLYILQIVYHICFPFINPLVYK